MATVLSELLPPAETPRPDVAWIEAAGLDLLTSHYSSDVADDAVQANIVSVYGQ